ncbi:hypothetical protein HGRIS_001692 [Hohenbuehelia grisea]|uniref:BTB domain-containing protein n=1 Tax=Hohenbuehelia grisea TaxID=104357 RepID=A0ABR3JJX2_9AGAR
MAASLSLSTTFHPNSSLHESAPDLALLSSDSVLFCVHVGILNNTSANAFNGILDDLDDTTKIPIDGRDVPMRARRINVHSVPLDVILHAVYNISCAHHAPPTVALVEAVDLLPAFGVNPQVCIYASPTPSPLYALLFAHAPLHPLPIYTLAAHHNIYALAVNVSQHLLGIHLDELPDAVVSRMGAVYLKKLVYLHLGRSEALKRILKPLPAAHAPSALCGAEARGRLERAWMFAVSYLTWDARPDMSAASIEAALRPLGENLTCSVCKQQVRERLRSIAAQWLTVKRTV